MIHAATHKVTISVRDIKYGFSMLRPYVVNTLVKRYFREMFPLCICLFKKEAYQTYFNESRTDHSTERNNNTLFNSSPV